MDLWSLFLSRHRMFFYFFSSTRNNITSTIYKLAVGYTNRDKRQIGIQDFTCSQLWRQTMESNLSHNWNSWLRRHIQMRKHFVAARSRLSVNIKETKTQMAETIRAVAKKWQRGWERKKRVFSNATQRDMWPFSRLHSVQNTLGFFLPLMFFVRINTCN